MQLENYCEGEPKVDGDTHGHGGPLKVSHGGGFSGHRTEVDKWLKATAMAGMHVVPDVQDFQTTNGVSVSGPSVIVVITGLHSQECDREEDIRATYFDGVQAMASWVDGQTGRRSDPAHYILHPLLDSGKTGLRVLTNLAVNRILFNSHKRAIGVELDSGIIVLARKQVVVSSGTMNSSQILERSGIGSETRLKELHIPVILNNPAVGQSYQDHQLLLVSYKSNTAPTHTLDALWQGRRAMDELIAEGKGMAGWTGVLIGGKLHPSTSEVDSMDPEFQKVYKEDYTAPQKPVSFFAGGCSLVSPHISNAPAGQYFTFAIATAYGRSRGYIHTLGNPLVKGPDFDTGFFSDPTDIKILAWTYKKTREIARRLDDYAGGFTPTHPVFDKSSRASFDVDDVYLKELGSDKDKIQDIVYTKDDDEAIEAFLRETVSTMWHSAGTCAMKPLKEGGVIDKNLNVHGVEGVKVAGKEL
jgi:alcohol oxidase